jgi:hypothetical protein
MHIAVSCNQLINNDLHSKRNSVDDHREINKFVVQLGREMLIEAAMAEGNGEHNPSKIIYEMRIVCTSIA